MSNCRITRQRAAPSASRSAISFWRDAARESIRFATLAHAISSTPATTPHNTHSAVRVLLPTVCRSSGTTETSNPTRAPECSRAMRAWMPFISARAWASATPGLSRASVLNQWPRRSCGKPFQPAASQSSLSSGNWNPRGITPMMV